ncbi:3'(2'),5'-bisphosphate nucleotidase CysQ [Roseomonas sp. NAR14]|uniref:3'(2'),5'-bisphosphate nucleotidase CysQ n=1 Tax=Roseomonas acroporae TaxID=2937791 RepID=A0A9X1Y9J5_9PROT|nr:3'(2'),5'-bisphosphate nucleotidase CysQ [Roseomonas acroporae]MCK8784850.1 3'(2'),5'-bisphosphate nucleotidase CysQ [Roseomonas acroporae]
MEDAELLELAASLARRAAAAILAVRRAGFAVDRKSDLSPVTEADRIAEALIVEGLRAATPDIAVAAEEEIAGGYLCEPGEAGCRLWLVDPLDGTKEFAAGRDEFTVNIGLVEGDRPRLGVVAVPHTGELFGAIVGQGAWKEMSAWKEAGNGEPPWEGPPPPRRPIAVRTPPAEGLTVLTSRSHGDEARVRRLLGERPVARLERFGSALKICRVAEGAADLYPRFGRTMEWDTAGPQAVLEAAGGRLVTADGAPLGYGKPEFENSDFLCWGRDAA